MPFFKHSLTEIVEMVGKSLFLFAYVEFLDVVDEFLFEAVFVVFHFGDCIQAVYYSLPYFLHPCFLEWFNLAHELFNIVNFLAKFLL